MANYTSANSSIQEILDYNSKVLMPVTVIDAVYEYDGGTLNGIDAIMNQISKYSNKKSVGGNNTEPASDYSVLVFNPSATTPTFGKISFEKEGSETKVLASTGKFITASTILKYNWGPGFKIIGDNTVNLNLLGETGYIQLTSSSSALTIGFSDTAKKLIPVNSELTAATTYVLTAKKGSELPTLEYQKLSDLVSSLSTDTTQYCTGGLLVGSAVPTVPSNYIFNSDKLTQVTKDGVTSYYLNGENIYSAIVTLNNKLNNVGGKIAVSSIDSSTNTTAYYLVGTASGSETELSSVIRTRYDDSNCVYVKTFNLYQTSDENLKTFTKDIDINFEDLKKIPKKEFYWNSDPSMIPDIGTGARTLEKYYPQLVTEEKSVKSVAYNKLSIVALAAVDKLYDITNALKKENELLKEQIGSLKEELEILKNR